MKERMMADLLIGDTRFDRNRKPNNIETSVLTVLIKGKADAGTFELLNSSTAEAAHEKESSEAVSAIASIVAGTALCFPSEFFLVQSKQELPLFLGSLMEIKKRLYPSLRANTDRSDVTASEGVIYEKWCWGISVGILEVLRWICPSKAMIEKGIYWHALIDVMTPFFLKIIDGFEVSPMPKPLDAYLASMIQGLAKEKSDQFELLVRQMAKQHRGPDFGNFGNQIYTELRNRYWFTRSEKQQEKMIS